MRFLRLGGYSLGEILQQKRGRRLGLTLTQIIGADCARCARPFLVDTPREVFEPARGVRVYKCQGGCGPKAEQLGQVRVYDDEPAATTAYDGDEWLGHYFPDPTEAGCDPESYPQELAPCACGLSYREFDLYGQGCAL